ncbi:MAG: heme o synthase [Gammaproteobacteria bacterium]|nr:heme o synthase [Gammaproteobacteria bacterium]
MHEKALNMITSINYKSYWTLCKPKVVALIIFTAVVGMLLASPDSIPWHALFFGTLGIGIGAASGAAMNHWVDFRIDGVMDRTSDRPLPQGDLPPYAALIFSLVLAVISSFILVVFVNNITAVLTFLSLIGYAVIYTMYLKRTTPMNIVLGGAAGAAPPLLGWAAVTNEVPAEALLLFLIIFVWTPPHFWALAIKRREEYRAAGIPMLPVTHGVGVTKYQILLYTILLVVISVLPFFIQMSGLIYLSGAIALGIGFLYYAIKLYREGTDEIAMKTFGYSILYLSLLFGFLLLDHYARLIIRTYFM